MSICVMAAESGILLILKVIIFSTKLVIQRGICEAKKETQEEIHETMVQLKHISEC